MRWIGYIALAIWWIGGALAAETPGNIGIWKPNGVLGDSGNAVAPDDLTVKGQFRIGDYQIVFRVPTNAALQAAAPPAAGSTVYRAGFYAAGDSGAGFYTYATTACSLNGGNGDDGWQVRASNGGCWIADLSMWGGAFYSGLYGVRCNGIADDTAPLQRFFNRVQNGATLRIQPGNCVFRSTLAIAPTGSYTKVTIAGSGYYSTRFVYEGASTTVDLIKVGSGTLGDGNIQTEWTITGFMIDTHVGMTAGAALHLWHFGRALVDPVVGGQDGNGGFYDGIWYDECETVIVPYVAVGGAYHDLMLCNGSRVSESWFPNFTCSIRLGKGKISPSNRQVGENLLPVSGIHLAGGVGGFTCDAVDVIGSQVNLRVDNPDPAISGNQHIVFYPACFLDGSKYDNLYLNDTNGPGSANWMGGAKLLEMQGAIASCGNYVGGGSPTANCVNINNYRNGILQISGNHINNAAYDGVLYQDGTATLQVANINISHNGRYGIESSIASPRITLTYPTFDTNPLGDMSDNVLTSTLPLSVATHNCPGPTGLSAQTGGTTGITYAANKCIYELSGNSVRVFVEMQLTNAGTGSGALTYIGLPVGSSLPSSGVFLSGYAINLTSVVPPITGAIASGGLKYGNLYQGAASGLQTFNQSNLTNTSTIDGIWIYQR